MAEFEGHFLPGLILISLSCWWIWDTWTRFFRQTRDSAPDPVPGKSAHPCCSTAMEARICFLITTCGIIIEGFFGGSQIPAVIRWQHAALYMFFWLKAAVDILVKKGAPLPERCDYAFMVLAYVMEYFIMAFHNHGRKMVDAHLHTLAAIAFFACAVSTIAEMFLPRQELFTLLRAVCTMVQGIWIFMIAFILYSWYSWPELDHDHERVMLVTTLFAWVVGGAVLVAALIGLVVYRRELRKGEPNSFCKLP